MTGVGVSDSGPLAWRYRARLPPRSIPILEFVIELIVELVFDIVFQLIVELGWEGVAHSRRRRGSANPLLAALGYAVIGSLVGFVSLFVVPHRLLPPIGVRGASLLLSPLATGGLMRAYGEFRRRRDLPTTNLATFWGGATFAFFLALVRFLAYGW